MADSAPVRGAVRSSNSERHGAWCVSLIVFAVMAVWTAFHETAAKYALYALPFAIPAVYLVVERGKLGLYRSGLFALMLYLGFALGSLLYNGPTGFFTYRDLLIIGGNLLLFTIYVRPPPLVADMAMVTLGAGLLIEAIRNGVGLNINFFSGDGIVESVLAFPLGVVFLYYFHERKWVRTFIALFLLFAAFKRIALFAAFIAVFIDIGFRLLGGRGIDKYAAAAFVLVCSLVALLSDQLFSLFIDVFAPQGLDANDISVGRFQLATLLWDHVANHGSSHTVFGFGPGAADDLIDRKGHIATNPHNDWLKLFFDYGIVGFAGAHVVLFILHARNTLGLMIYIYSAVLMMTDNTLIYTFYFVFVFLMMRIGLRDRYPLLRYRMGNRHLIQPWAHRFAGAPR